MSMWMIFRGRSCSSSLLLGPSAGANPSVTQFGSGSTMMVQGFVSISVIFSRCGDIRNNVIGVWQDIFEEATGPQAGQLCGSGIGYEPLPTRSSLFTLCCYY